MTETWATYLLNDEFTNFIQVSLQQKLKNRKKLKQRSTLVESIFRALKNCDFKAYLT